MRINALNFLQAAGILRMLLLAPVIALALVLTGCEDDDASPLRVGLVVWPPFEMPYLASELGYYEDANIQLVHYGSPSEFLQAYQGGLLDVVATTTDYVLQVQRRDPHQKIVMVIDHSHGGDAIVAKPEFASMTELKGRRVGYEASALGAYVLARALEKSGMKIGDVEPVPVDLHFQETAFREGQVDAVVTYEPTVSILEEEGARVVFDSTEIPQEIIDVLMVSESAIARKSAQLKKLVDGWFKAIDYLERNPLEAAKIVADREGLTPEAYLQTFDKIRMAGRELNQAYLSGRNDAVLRSLEHHGRIMITNGFLSGPVELDSILDDQFVK